jgi:tetratricopeptide (TPR) repeat protein
VAEPEALPCLGDRYIILSRIGAGGMGRVYLAHDTRHDRRVAIKVLDPEYARALGTQRFVREIRIAAMLTHPGIVPLYDSGEFAGQLFYVMPHVEGESLRQRLQRETMLPVAQALAWAAEVADALAFANAHGIVHRDIKPENLLLEAGHLLIADFGIARAVDLAAEEAITSEQLVVGTPLYMSPEQAGGEKVDGRTDIYSLGCVLYEMLAGEPPYGGPTPQSVTAKKMAGRYPAVRIVRPAVPPAVDETLTRALAPIPADRFATAEEFSRHLRAATNPKGGRPFRWLALLGLVVAGLALAFAHLSHRASLAPARSRVVVGIFENRTGDTRLDPLGFMAADWVTEGLQRTGAVDVVPTLTSLTAARYLRKADGVGDPVRALARETGADLVVTGSIYQDRDTLVLQAQLANAQAGRLVGAVEPIRTGDAQPAEALQQLRARLMGLLALSLDDRVIVAERPPTYIAYQAFSEGIDAYLRNDYRAAVAAFGRAHALDSTFVLPLLYAAFCNTNLRDFATADSVLRIVSGERDRLSEYDRHWLDYETAQLASNDADALAAIRRAAELAPSSKASYNFAVTAFEARQPFPSESALRRLSPDVGPMRGWLPYWDLLTSALHAQGKFRQELSAAREARRRFPDRLAAYVPEARALAARHDVTALDELWSAAGRTGSAPVGLAALANEVGEELWAHGDSSGSRRWFVRAYRTVAPGFGTPVGIEARRERARAAARLGRLREAREIGEALAAEDPTRRDADLGSVGVLSAELGDRPRAQAILDRLAADDRPFTFGEPQFQAGRIAAVLGDNLRATRLLESAHRKGYPYDLNYHRDPALARVRGLPIARDLVAPTR